MKLKFLLPLAAFSMLITACGDNKKQDSTPKDPGDGYVDVLPEKTADGSILHCFNWTYKQIEENIENIAKAGFKSVQLSPVQQPKSGGPAWWAYYQPVSFSIAKSTPLGTKEELASLCETAENYGVSVIADIVFNHLANIKDTELESDGTPKVSEEVKKYEPEIYALRNDKNNPTFHHDQNLTGSGRVTHVYPYGKLPDLNTSNKLVQERAYSLLKECIDVGIDGFRFDAAKHIETPDDDPKYASDFWPNTVGKARTYYKDKTNKELFAYGEILHDVDGNRDISSYTKHMAVTDSNYISGSIAMFVQGKGESIAKVDYSKNTEAKNLVTWVESHDNFADEAEAKQTHTGVSRVNKMWAVLASRKDSRGLYFARPDDSLAVGKIHSYTFENEELAVVNRFHNRFVGADEKQFGQGKFYVNQRFDEKQAGAVIVALGKDKKFKTSSLDKLPNGVYFDQLTGKSVKVSNGKASFEIDETGIAVLTRTKNEPHPQIEISERGGSFVGTKEITIKVKNAIAASYTINGGEQVEFKDSIKVKIGDVVDENNMVNLEVTATSRFSLTKRASFKKVALVEGGFNISNFNTSYLNDYEVYLWCWDPSRYSHDYKVVGNTLVVNATGLKGIVIVLFEKGYTPAHFGEPGPYQWDSKCVNQSGDITEADFAKGFYDASGF